MTDRQKVIELVKAHPGSTAKGIAVLLGKKGAGTPLSAGVASHALTKTRIRNERYPYAGTWAYFPSK